MTDYLVDGRRLPAHALADLFPPGDVAELAADIRANGQDNPIRLTADGAAVLDGRTRAAACERAGVPVKWECAAADADPIALVLTANVRRRHLNESQRGLVAIKIAASIEAISQSDAAEQMNVSRSTVQRAALIAADEVLEPAVEAGALALGDAVAVRREPAAVKRAAVAAVKRGEAPTAAAAASSIKRAARRDKARQEAETSTLPSNLFVSDISQLAKHVKKESIDVIATDPPYESSAVYLYGKLRNFAVYALKPDGVLLVMTGQMHLPKVMAELNHYLMEWQWCITYATPQKRGEHVKPRVRASWKPILVYRRRVPLSKPFKGRFRSDLITAPPDTGDKAAHEWGQSVGGWRAVLDEWTDPGQTVCDPFCGAGSTLIAARQLGRQVIGSDIDAGHVETTRKRLAAL